MINKDYIFQIYDGSSQAAPLLANLCGYSIPASVFSSGNSLWFKLQVLHYDTH